MSNNTEATEIPALGEGYSHARKAYGLVSALLMTWELIGVELQASPVENLKITLKSPQAAPYVLIVLIVYFGFRITIEWYQNDIRRRCLRASRIDLVVAHAIAIGAILLYAFQALSKIQVANTVAPSGLSAFIAALTSGLLFRLILGKDNIMLDWRKYWAVNVIFLIGGVAFLIILVLIVYSAARTWNLSQVFLSLLGLPLGWIIIPASLLDSRSSLSRKE